jgi:MFS family permease
MPTCGGSRADRRRSAVSFKAARASVHTFERMPGSLPDVAALQRRTVRVLVAAQVLGGLGGSAAAAAALLARDMTGRDSLASLPLALIVIGSATMVMPISVLSRRAGRRAGLTTALGLAAAGAAGSVAAGALDSFLLLLAASALFGGGTTAVMLARYGAADLSTPPERGRAIGTVVFATTFGAVAGPNLLEPAGSVAEALALPHLTGLYVFAAVAFTVAALVLWALLRPDPLQVATALDRAAPEQHDRMALRELLAAPAALAGLATMVVANFTMVAVMAMAPVHMDEHGHDLRVVGLVVSLHIAGMFAPAPLTGRLTDRLGPLPVAAAGTALLIGSGALAGVAGHGAAVIAVALTLLGIGWNAGLIAGSTLLASAVPLAQRPRAEGAGELAMGFTAAGATAIAGPIVGLAGYAALTFAAGLAAAALVPLLVALRRRGLPAHSVPAQRVLA